ncbi:MAG: hypothetical protein ACOCRX_12230 [Candidatus Woesearchaeota archaeon]
MDIPKEYKKNGYKWELLKSNNNVGLYYNKESNTYEVIIIRPNPNYLKEFNINGVLEIVKNNYLLPSNEDFGTYGWSFIERTNAEKQLKDVSNSQNQKIKI